MWILKPAIVYYILVSTVCARDQLGAGWFITIRLNIAQELDWAALIRFFALITLPWPVSLQLSSISSFHQVDPAGTLSCNFIPALQITTCMQHVNTTIHIGLCSVRVVISHAFLLHVLHRVLLFIRMRKVLNKHYYYYQYLATVLPVA